MHQLAQSMRNLLARAKMAERSFMVVTAIIIGVLGGLGAVGFRALIGLVNHYCWGESKYSLEQISALPWWWIVLVPAAGGLIVGPMVHFLAREAKGHGVPEVMEAVALRSGYIRPRLVIIKSLASALSIGTGGSVGREGPIVQIGSALGSTIGQLLQVSGRRLRTLVGCGAAAGIAATFNAPVAGALFAVEVILGDFGITQFSPIVISAVMATVVARHYLGDFPAFIVPEYSLLTPWELPIYLVLGVVAAIVSLVFVRFLYKTEDLWDALPGPEWIRAAFGGAVVGAIGILFPHVLGVGYEGIETALSGQLGLGMLMGLIVLKIFATSTTIGSGGSGGIFAPSLFLGAMTGGMIGTMAEMIFPGLTGGPGAYALVGMGAVVAGTTHAPITAILIIFELTSDYKLILPLMAACIISSLVTTREMRESIYTMKLVRRGVNLSGGRELNVLKSLNVGSVMSTGMVTVPASEPLAALLEKATESESAYVYVTEEGTRLVGVTALTELRNKLRNIDAVGQLLVASELARTDVPVVTPEENLDTVMRIFSGKSREELPVVDSQSNRRLIGVVTRRHLIDAYNKELMKRDMVSTLGGGLRGTESSEIQLGDGHVMSEMDAPGIFLGKAIKELEIRSRYNVQVLLVRRPPSADRKEMVEMVPGPETRLERGDRLVFMGPRKALERLKSL